MPKLSNSTHVDIYTFSTEEKCAGLKNVRSLKSLTRKTLALFMQSFPKHEINLTKFSMIPGTVIPRDFKYSCNNTLLESSNHVGVKLHLYSWIDEGKITTLELKITKVVQ